MTELEDKVNWCINKITKIEKRLNVNNKPWYKSVGIWLAIVSVVLMLYIIYMFYMTEHGYGIALPQWMR